MKGEGFVYTVLVVDDSPLMRQFVGRALGMTGFKINVQEAGNGLEAMRLAQSLLPDLIITDLNMPELNGEELLTMLAEDSDLRSTPIIVLTAGGAKTRADIALRHRSVAACIQKPIRPEELRRYLEHIFRPDSGAAASESRVDCEPVSNLEAGFQWN